MTGSDASPLFTVEPARKPPASKTGRRPRLRQIFVVSLARSGSTLLRYLLDTHPEIASPPELNLSALLAHVVEVWTRSNEARGIVLQPGAPLPPEICRRARKVVDEIMRTFADDTGASVFCDKSLTTVDHLQVVSQCYPAGSFIFLYRYPLDFIASGIEACQWGYNAYGFAPYVAGNVANFVSGLGNYWIDRVSKMVEFERTCTAAHARLYYELLCDDPNGTLTDLMQFLDLERDDTLVERTFDSDHGHGPGDYKIDFTRSITADSIGRGATIPQLLGPGQVSRINELLAELDYPSLEAGWRGNLAGMLGLRSAKDSMGEARRIAEEVVATLSARQPPSVGAAHLPFLPMYVMVRAGAGSDAWMLVGSDGRFTLVDEPVDSDETSERPKIRCAGDVLARVIGGELTLGHAIHDGRVRYEAATGTQSRDTRPRRALAAFAAVLDAGGEI
jgi:hypothetical protein